MPKSRASVPEVPTLDRPAQHPPNPADHAQCFDPPPISENPRSVQCGHHPDVSRRSLAKGWRVAIPAKVHCWIPGAQLHPRTPQAKPLAWAQIALLGAVSGALDTSVHFGLQSWRSSSTWLRSALWEASTFQLPATLGMLGVYVVETPTYLHYAATLPQLLAQDRRMPSSCRVALCERRVVTGFQNEPRKNNQKVLPHILAMAQGDPRREGLEFQ